MTILLNSATLAVKLLCLLMVTNSDEPVKVLLAEDDPDDRQLFQEALIKAEILAILATVEDGQELMNYLFTSFKAHPDIIFLDINMPFKDGKQCLKEIRSNEKLSTIPVVMFSTSHNECDIAETFAEGANLFITKPNSFEDEVKILKKVLSADLRKDLFKLNKDKFVLRT